MESFHQIRVGKLVWLARTLALPLSLRAPMENPEAFLRDSSQFIKSSRVVTIARVPPNLILRRLNYGKFIHRSRDFFRPSRVMRALIASSWLEEAGVRTPRAIAAAEVRCCRWPKTAYLITEEVPNARTLAAMFRDRALRTIPPRVAELIAHLHNSGLSHRDLKWTNILFDDQLSPWLIDTDGVRRIGRVPDARAREDLFSLARCFNPHPITLKWSGGRFLHRYCKARNMCFKSWAKALLQRLQSGS